MLNYLIITGGSRGIGKATIATFIKQGWKIINISRTNCEILGVKNINIDLADEHWANDFAQSLSDEVKNADRICLVHNAAIFKRDNVATLDESDFRSVLQINLISPVTLNKIFLPHMKPNSSIVYIGTTLAEQAIANRASYVITKHALIGLMRSTCQDLVGRDISTCCVCPGFVNTEMLTNQVDAATLQHLIQEKVTAGRLIEPEEISDLIYFCANNPVINGSVIHANLGQITK